MIFLVIFFSLWAYALIGAAAMMLCDVNIDYEREQLDKELSRKNQSKTAILKRHAALRREYIKTALCIFWPVGIVIGLGYLLYMGFGIVRDSLNELVEVEKKVKSVTQTPQDKV